MPATEQARHHPLVLLGEDVARDLYALGNIVLSRELAALQPGQREFARILGIFVDETRHALTEQLSQAQNDPERTKIAQLYQTFCLAVRTDFLPYLGELQGIATPPEVLDAASAMVRQLFPDFALILYPTGERFPETLFIDDIGAYLAGLVPWAHGPPPPLAEASRPLVVLSYPELHARNPVYHSLLLGHEIMHLLVESSGLCDSVAPNIELTPGEFQQLFNDWATRPLFSGVAVPLPTLGEALTEANLSSAITDRWHLIRDNWLIELACDLLAVRLLGPCYVFAFAQQALAADILDYCVDSHPRPRFRLDLMLSELRYMNYRLHDGQRRRPTATYLRHLARLVAGPSTEEQELIFQLAEKSIGRRRRDLQEKVRAVQWPEAYSWERFRDFAVPLLGTLRAGVPPGERISWPTGSREPATLPDILNTAFEFELAHLEDIYSLLEAHDDDSRLSAYQRFQDLVLMALQSSEILRTWAAAKRELREEGTNGGHPD
jgi:hypothetical protein